jgi:hypothetical protein
MSRNNLEKLEENTIHSFKRAKTDIIYLQTQVIELTQSQKQLLHFVNSLRAELQSTKNKVNGVVKKTKVSRNKKPVKKATTQRKAMKIVRPKRKAKSYVASKTGKKFHQRKCPFAQNIKPKSKRIFKTRTKALNTGYKPCNCSR